MASILRSGLVTLATRQTLLSKAVAHRLPCLQQAAGIQSKVFRDINGIKRPPPFDYVNKKYKFRHSLLDDTIHRFDENSKLVVVEGSIATGKSDIAEQLAKELDMHFIRAPSMDDVYINPYGFDFRTLDAQLPKGARTFDETKFLAEPNNRLTGSMLLNYYHLRLEDYLDALIHLFSTGQGVVLERSIFSDRVFSDVLYQNNYISKHVHIGLQMIRDNSMREMLKPHLVIYLDAPVNVIQQNIRKRNKYGEASSPLFKDNKFLTDMQDAYKFDYLNDMEPACEMLVYDWTNGGDIETIVEDIERIDFNNYYRYDKKIEEWRLMWTSTDWCEKRMIYVNGKEQFLRSTNVPYLEAEELWIDPNDLKKREDLYEQAPGMEYAYGFNAALGDIGFWNKNKAVPYKRQRTN